jgi:hypothetical protein
VTIREIVTDWTLPSGAGHVSVMYFDTTPTVVSQRAFVNNFWNSVRALQSTTTIYRIREAGRELDSATGALTGAWTEGTVFNQAGSAGTTPVPDATQALVQWRTATIVNGRFLRGRTFIPGLGSGQMQGGNVIGSAVTAINAAATALVSSSAVLSVWHRPIAGSGGSQVPATAATVWTEFAVLRRRRG